MIQLFVTFLPYALAGYFLYRSINQPIFFFGIPFLMFFRSCIFFESAKLFRYPFFTYPDINLLVWLLIIWFVFKYKLKQQPEIERDTIGKRLNINILDYCIIGLIIISTYGLITVFVDFYAVEDVFAEFFGLLALFVGYFIMKNVTKNVDSNELADFLFNIVIVNSVASTLYILHQGLHVSLYEGVEFSMEIVQGELITRTFWFMPILSFFSISYLLIFKKITSLPIFALLLINILGLFITYTRSFLITSVIIILLYFLLIGIKERDYIGMSTNLIISIALGLVFFLGVNTFLPANTSYFMSRFADIKENPNDEESNSLLFRFGKTKEIIDRIDKDKVIFGFGPVTEDQIPFVSNMKATTADLVWTGVVFRWGYMGLILFIVLYIASLVKAFKIFIHNNGILSNLGLLFILVIISQIFEGFTSWTFLSPSRFGLGLWYFGILSGLTYMNDSIQSETLQLNN